MTNPFVRKPRTSQPSRKINSRAIMGIAMIAVAALGSWGIYRVALSTSVVLVANRMLVEGEQVTSADVTMQEVASGAFHAEYVSDPALIIGKVVTRVVHPGELIPRASIGEASETLQTTLVIELSSAIASSLHEGAIVDVWAADSPKSSSASTTSPSAPHAVVRRARLAQKHDASGALSSGAQVEIVLPRASVPDVLQAVAHGDAMTVVASSGGLNS